MPSKARRTSLNIPALYMQMVGNYHEAQVDIEQHEQLISYLQLVGVIDSAETIRCRTLPGGVSCRTVLVERSVGEDLVCKQALEFLRVAEVWPGDPARVEREAEAMRVLGELLRPDQIPRLVFHDPNEHVVVMTAVPEPHENWKAILLRGDLKRRDVVDFAAILGAMHRGAFERRHELARRFADRSQFESLRVDPYYRFTAQCEPEAAGFVQALIDDTASASVTLVHGDFSPKNVLVRPAGLVLLDHEVAHWGDPAFDIGFASAHFFGKANHLDGHRQRFADAARLFWNTYAAETDALPWFAATAERAVRHSLACTLARVSGKSPLDYLTPADKARQRQVTLALIVNQPSNYGDLVDRYVELLAGDSADSLRGQS